MREGNGAPDAQKGEGFGERGSQVGFFGRADSGKHANSFSYACEKVMEAPYAQKGEGFGERGSQMRFRPRADLHAKGRLSATQSSFHIVIYMQLSATHELQTATQKH